MFLPLRNNVLILGQEDPDTWGNGLIVRPESTKDRCDQGLVKAVGPDVKGVQVGDYVTFSPYSGKVLNELSEGYKNILISEDGIDCIVLPATTPTNGLYISSALGEYIPCTVEAAMIVCREAMQAQPKVIELKKRWTLARTQE